MPEYRRTRPRSVWERIYRAQLYAYPRAFRDEFGDAMVEFFRDRIARAQREGRSLAGVRMLARALVDVARNAVPAHLDAWRDAIQTRRSQRLASIGAASLASPRREDHVLSSIMQDLRFAVRGMQRAPSFALTVLATLAIGIGASVAVFSVVNGVLLKALPYSEPSRVVQLQHLAPFGTVSEGEFVDYRREMTALASLSAYRTVDVTINSQGGEPERVRVATVTENFFKTLGARLWLGRPFTPDEERRGGPFAAVLSYGLWRTRFGGDSTIVGRTFALNGGPRTIVGVLSPGAEFPDNRIALWIPHRLNYDTLWTRNNHYMFLIGRLAPDSAIGRAAVQFASLARRFVRDFPETYDAKTPIVTKVAPLSSVLVADARPYIVTLFVAVTLVLLIACVNVANLMLARGESRRRDVAIRSALGASRYRVVRQALTESVLFAAIGGTAGLAIAAATVRALRAVIPASVPRVSEISVDVGVLAFAIGITLLTGVLCGVVPALRVARDDASETLKEGGRGSSGARGRGRMRRALAVAQIALALVTLSGAGLMMRSLWNMQATDLGFTPNNVLAVELAPPPRYNGDVATQLYDRIIERVRAIPGVEAAGAVEDLPITDDHSEWSILIDGAPMTSVGNAPSAMPQRVAHEYFDAMRIPIMRGRVFAPTDRVDAPLVVVVNESMARVHWPGKDPIGGTIKMLNETAPWATVVGVVKDVRSSGILGDVPTTMYFPQSQAGQSAGYVPSQMWLIVRTTGDPHAIVSAVRAIVREIEPAAPIAKVQTMDEAVSASVAPRRFTSLLLLGFATVALALAGLGIYSVIAYSVSQRRAEMGIRIALGASRGRVIGQVLGEGIRTACIGAIGGLLIAVGATRFLRALVVGVSPGDPITLGTVTLALMLVALLASYVPARRASGVDPVRAIRAEL